MVDFGMVLYDVLFRGRLYMEQATISPYTLNEKGYFRFIKGVCLAQMG
jgi:hypothetical protein